MMLKANPRSRADMLLLVAFCGFLFFYGLGAFGLIGADEPRYAQVAREMLEHSDWVTPTLLGKPWLEKPPLYYWQAMLAFRLGGVSDRTARIPAAFDAALMVAAVYFFLRQFRSASAFVGSKIDESKSDGSQFPGIEFAGSEFDAALITASSAGVIGFARAAATDMPLAACFTIALLAWYAWYIREKYSREKHAGENYANGKHIYLAVFYIFVALGTLAKGPVAPALAAIVILAFIALRRDWRAIPRALWLPGVAIYLAVTLPWYIAVQLRNPEFFRVFILEHNFARFSQDLYHHRQPFWFYVPVFLLAMMPWTLVLIAAIVQRVRLHSAEGWSSGKAAFSGAKNSWPLFLLIWMLVPILFFSVSQSKLPGYILPAVPAGALLAAGYLTTLGEKKISLVFAAAHGILCALLIFAALATAPIALDHRLRWSTGTGTSATGIDAAVAAVFAIAISSALLTRAGSRLLTRTTLFAVVVSVAAVIRMAAPAIDATQSARPIAETIQAFSHEPVPVALYRVRRQQEYGLEFYLNRPAEKYEDGDIPSAAHVLVAAKGTELQVAQLVPGRRVSYLTSLPAQRLDLYWVGK
jgi:4-amino-4-deoxy-L-arabinose transferase-like glycosyltransferase